MSFVRSLIPLLFVLLMPFSALGHLNDTLSRQHIVGFADYLESIGEYRRAGNELERLLIVPGSPLDQLALRIGALYLRADSFVQAERTFRDALFVAPPTTKSLLRYHLAEALYRQQKLMPAISELETVVSLPSQNDTSSVPYSAALFRALCFAELREWDSARVQLAGAATSKSTPEQQHSVSILTTVLDESSQLPQKSPLLAGVLSTLIPGLGKVYTGHTTDGILSFVSIATLTYAAYDGFVSEGSGSVRGYIYGFLAGGLYLGNIYGSALSASIVREESTRTLQARLRLAFSLEGIPR